MTPDQIDDLYRAAPFQPFTLFLADGRSHPVPASDCMTIGDDGRTLFLFLPDSNESELIDVALAVSARFSESQPGDEPGPVAAR